MATNFEEELRERIFEQIGLNINNEAERSDVTTLVESIKHLINERMPGYLIGRRRFEEDVYKEGYHKALNDTRKALELD